MIIQVTENTQSMRSKAPNTKCNVDSNSTKNGIFITFEGGEGAGKTTQIKRLARKLNEIGVMTTVTREPGGTPIAESIRNAILSGSIKEFGPTAEAMLFAAARLDHVDMLIKPALKRGNWVLCDRFTDSTLVYQGEDGVKKDVIVALENIAIGETIPNLTIIIDIKAQEGLKRSRNRSELKLETAPDRFEQESIEIHEKRRQAFLRLANYGGDRYAVVDGHSSVDEVEQHIWQLVFPLTQ